MFITALVSVTDLGCAKTLRKWSILDHWVVTAEPPWRCVKERSRIFGQRDNNINLIMHTAHAHLLGHDGSPSRRHLLWFVEIKLKPKTKNSHSNNDHDMIKALFWFSSRWCCDDESPQTKILSGWDCQVWKELGKASSFNIHCSYCREVRENWLVFKFPAVYQLYGTISKSGIVFVPVAIRCCYD